MKTAYRAKYKALLKGCKPAFIIRQRRGLPLFLVDAEKLYQTPVTDRGFDVCEYRFMKQ